MRHRTTHHAFTLLEAALAMTVLSVLAAVLSPMMLAASQSYATAFRVREATEQSAYAMDRVVRMLRETPISQTSPDLLAIVQASPSMIQFESGHRIELIDDTLMMTGSDAISGSLCQQVDIFEILSIDSDGQTPVSDATHAHSFRIRLRAAGLELSSVVFPRVRMGDP